jgi:hypothetical protein
MGQSSHPVIGRLLPTGKPPAAGTQNRPEPAGTRIALRPSRRSQSLTYPLTSENIGDGSHNPVDNELMGGFHILVAKIAE